MPRKQKSAVVLHEPQNIYLLIDLILTVGSNSLWELVQHIQFKLSRAVRYDQNVPVQVISYPGNNIYHDIANFL